MRILLVHNFYRSKAIGGEDVTFDKEKKALQEALGSENVFIYVVSSDGINFLKILLNLYFSVGHFLGIYHAIKRNKIDIVHCHNFFPLISFSVFVASRIAGVKSVLTLHNYRLWCSLGIFFRNNKICYECVGKYFFWPSIRHKCYHSSRSQSIIAATALFCYNKIIKHSIIDAVIVLSDFQKSFISKNNLIEKDKIYVKPHFIEMKTITHVNLEKKEFDVVFIGKLEQAKGVISLIKFINEIGPNCKWLVIGDGPLSHSIEHINTENVTYLRRVEHSEVVKQIKKSKFLIQLSLMYETFGLTIIEAMSVGVPVIGFPIGTRTELIQDGITGYLLRDGSEINIIKDAINLDDIVYRELANNCLLEAHKFNKDSILHSQIKIYKTTIKG